MYKYVLQKEIIIPSDIIRPNRPERLPTVLSHQEAMSVINNLDFSNHQLIVRDGKGENDRA